MIYCGKTLLSEFILNYMPAFLDFPCPKSRMRKGRHDSRDYYQYYNLANQSYEELKKHCQETAHTGNYMKVEGEFSPLSFSLGANIGEVVRKFGKPIFVINNCHIMKGYRTLYFKRKVGDLKCMLQMHFHRRKLFLEQININQKEGMTGSHSFIIESLIGEHLDVDYDVKSLGEDSLKYFEDKFGNSISTTCDHFSARLIFTNPNSESLNELLYYKYKEVIAKKKIADTDYSRLIVKKA